MLAGCVSSVDEPYQMWGGSSKTNDTTLEKKYKESTQSLWHTPCTCGATTVATVEDSGGHLHAMIGPYHDRISSSHPATLCHACRRPIHPGHGYWVHRYPERARVSVGLHIPQPIMPMHFTNPVKWRQLIGKKDGAANFGYGKYLNEVLGEPYDLAHRLITEAELQKAGQGRPANTVENCRAACRSGVYQWIAVGVDWSGGGEDEVSRTGIAVVGLHRDGHLDVLYGCKRPSLEAAEDQARFILQLATDCGAMAIAHDYNGVGVAREDFLRMFGWPQERFMPLVYNDTPGKAVIDVLPAGGGRVRTAYRMSKPRSLQLFCSAVRRGRVRLFAYDYVNADSPGVLVDFTVLSERVIEAPGGSNVYRVYKASEEVSDDYAHACNMAAWCCWHAAGVQP